MSVLAGKKILVTGAEGFIGSHLVEHLQNLGANVRAFVLYNAFNSWGWLDTLATEGHSLDVFCGDVRDPHGVRLAMQDCEIVMHLAALIAIPYSYHSPDTYVDTNVKGTLNVLQAARELGIAQVIHTSTSEVYGSARYVPITEEHPLQGQSPYSASKIASDHLALSFYYSFDTPVSVVRPFNTYGPRQSARAIIPTVITQIAKGHSVLQLGDLSPTRDFNYIEDTVRGFVAAAESQSSIGQVINIGSHYEISIGDTVQLIADLMGAKVTIEQASDRMRPPKSEVRRLWACNQKAKTLLNWEPQYAGKEGLKRGLEKTIAWFTQDVHLQHYKASIYNL